MKPYVVGIDIGGTNTVFGIVDARGNVIASSSIKTAKHSDVNDYINELSEALDNLLESNDAADKINGIGVGAPNANFFTGCVEIRQTFLGMAKYHSRKCLKTALTCQ